MRLRLVVGGLGLALGVAACGESVGPPAGVGQDLEFTVPVRTPPAAPEWKWSDTALARQAASRAPMGQAALSQLPAMLFDKFIVGAWDIDQLWADYGFLGAGTGYTMTASVEFAGPDGSRTKAVGPVLREDQLLYWSMTPTGRTRFVADRPCGTDGHLRLDVQVRAVDPLAPETFVSTNSGAADNSSMQARCSGTPGTGQRLDRTVTNGYRVYLCQYEVWTDIDGDVIDVFFFGCTEVTGDVFAA